MAAAIAAVVVPLTGTAVVAVGSLSLCKVNAAGQSQAAVEVKQAMSGQLFPLAIVNSTIQ